MLEVGATIPVGTHTVSVAKFLSEGGYSRIYEVQIVADTETEPDQECQVACLKQVKVADKAGLTELRKEVDVMRTLRDARNIVKYYDSHAERMPDDTYQVLVLMELCPNNSLLEYMNANIREKLTELQILKIMMEISVAVYEMHHRDLIHRDIKIENVLIDAAHRFKLCDFGSVSTPIRPPKDQQEFQMLSHDIMYHTTPQYRAPEMLDLTRGVPIDAKSDIWALGCFLYKLCYYITPFEAAGDIAIIHASFLFPTSPPAPLYSGDLKNLIIIMLQQDPRYRPNIVQLIMLLAKMCDRNFAEMNIEDFTRSGPYDFGALHEMQTEKQKQLMQQQQHQQQQYYYEQQQQVHQIAQQPQKVAAKDLMPSSSSHSSASRSNSSKSSKTPIHTSADVIPGLNNQTVPTCKSGDHNQVPLMSKSPSSAKSADLICKVPSHLRSGYISPLRPSSVAGHVDPGIDPGTHNPTDSKPNTHIALTVPSIPHKASPSISLCATPEPAEDTDILDLGNLDDIENRYPSLDALHQTAGSSSNSGVPVIKIKSLPSSATYRGANRKPSELENVEAWEKVSPQAILDRDAERLASDIFASGAPTPNEPKTPRSSVTTEPLESFRSSADLKDSSATSSQLPQSHRISDSKNIAEAKIDLRTEEKSDSELQPPIELSDVVVPTQEYKILSPVAHSAAKNLKVYLQPGSRSASLDQLQGQLQDSHSQSQQQRHQQLKQQQQNQLQALKQALPLKHSQQHSQQHQQLNYQFPVSAARSPYISLTKPSGAPLAGSIGPSNPWGSALDRTPKAEPKADVSHVSEIPDYELSTQFLALALDDSLPHCQVPTKHRAVESNLIELEVGLSSSSSLNVRTPSNQEESNNSYLEELSVIDLADDKELLKTRTSEEAKRAFKKSYPGLRDQSSWQEEVIDFASDDENNNSDLSRINIRQSLKKTRKSSEHRRSETPRVGESVHQQSESVGGDRKRLSFFGQSN